MADRPMLFDAGVWIASKDADDPNYDSARELVLNTSLPLATLDLTLYEIANGVVRRWRDPAKAMNLCESAASRCRHRFVSVDVRLIETTAVLAVEYKLTSYDAAYVAVARRHGWQLVSTDVKDLVSQGLAVTPDAAV
ncbi:MAG TPA: type II toxin-antitoxin system VapC family toxin [Solirubrobacterales bacterium]